MPVGTGLLDGPLRRKAVWCTAKFARRGQILPSGPSGDAGPYGVSDSRRKVLR